jgi:integrase
MTKGSRVNLTTARLDVARCPPGKSEIKLWDAVVPGLVVRVYGSGRKTFVLRYRPKGSGRRATSRHHNLGEVGAVSLADARTAAQQKLGELARGHDPASARRDAKRHHDRMLRPALDRYERSLIRRSVVKRQDVMSLLRRELLDRIGNVDLAGLHRAELVRRIEEVEDSGRPGTAQDLRAKVAVFLGWAVDRGLLTASPLAGWRRPRRTRAERLNRAGRAFEDWELPIFWQAASATGWPFGPYLQMLLLLGQRRTETALMAWRDVDLTGGEWRIPAAITKSARLHRVPLPSQAGVILKDLPRTARSDLVFPGAHGRAIAGWSKRLPPVYKATAAAGMAPWSLHDCRRSMRTGLGRLGVDRTVSELLLNHAISDELTAIYDRAEYWQQRVEAAARWANHVMGQIEGDGAAVVQLRATR